MCQLHLDSVSVVNIKMTLKKGTNSAKLVKATKDSITPVINVKRPTGLSYKKKKTNERALFIHL